MRIAYVTTDEVNRALAAERLCKNTFSSWFGLVQ